MYGDPQGIAGKAFREIDGLEVLTLPAAAEERSDDRVRVTVRLQRVSPESQVWANEYSRGIREVVGLEDEIARTVTGEIQVSLTPDERIRLAQPSGGSGGA